MHTEYRECQSTDLFTENPVKILKLRQNSGDYAKHCLGLMCTILVELQYHVS